MFFPDGTAACNFLLCLFDYRGIIDCSSKILLCGYFFEKVILSSYVHILICTRMQLSEVGPGSDKFTMVDLSWFLAPLRSILGKLLNQNFACLL